MTPPLWPRVRGTWSLAASSPAGTPCPQVIQEQDRLMLSVRRQLLAAPSFQVMSPLYNFHREPLRFHAVTCRGVHPVLAQLVARKLRGVVAPGPPQWSRFPERDFAYGDDLAAQLRFWRFLRWMSDIAGDLLSADARGARRTALDLHYNQQRRTPGVRRALESALRAASPSYQQLVARRLDAEFWSAFAFVGKGQPWDHFYYHLVLGTDPDARYWSGTAPSRAQIEQAVGL